MVGVVGSVYMPRGAVAWMDRGCNLPSAVVHTVTRGEPGTFEACVDQAEPDPTSDDGPNTPYVPSDTADPTTTVDPATVAEQERQAAEAERVETERQARVDACWAVYDAEWAAWDEGYAAWLDETGGTGMYDTYLADHPQPTEPACR